MDGKGRGGRARRRRRQPCVEGVVPTVADREAINRAAAEAGMPAGRFVGEAALERATGVGPQVARLEDAATVLDRVAGIQRELTDHLQVLQNNLLAAVRSAVWQHCETHRLLAVVLERVGRLEKRGHDAADGRDRDQSETAEARQAHGEILAGIESLRARLVRFPVDDRNDRPGVPPARADGDGRVAPGDAGPGPAGRRPGTGALMLLASDLLVPLAAGPVWG